MELLKVMGVLIFCGFVTAGPTYWHHSQELFQTLLTNTTKCQWITADTSPSTHFGFCSENVENCIHLGMLPRRVAPGYNTTDCQVCCARRMCGTEGFARFGVCLIPQTNHTYAPFTTIAPYTNSTETVFSTYNEKTNGTSTHQFAAYFDYDSEDCLSFGGQVHSGSPWWESQCPISSRCCLFPEVPKCEACGLKSGKPFNFTQQAMGKYENQDEMLAWKTAVNRMAGTGWNLGMQPVGIPGFMTEQYNQSPPTYDSLVPPQMWNNFLNRPGAPKKDDDDEDDEDHHHRGWCWQAAIYSKIDGRLRCGGALVAEKYIITTASCMTFINGDTISNYFVRLGGTDLRKRDEKYAANIDLTSVWVHPQFNATNWGNNVAIVETAFPAVCNNKYICTICLPSAALMSFSNFTGHYHDQWIREDIRQCVASGWGRKTAGGEFSPFLKEMGYFPIYNNATFCEHELQITHGSKYSYPENSFCAIAQPNMHGKIFPACDGDNGGPLACFFEGRYYLTGLISNPHRCDMVKNTNIVAKVLQPNQKATSIPVHVDFFTDIAQFIPWIYQTIYGVY